jgi:TonB family protein
MFDVLLESRHVRPPRPVVATAVSAAAHLSIVLVLVGGTAVATQSDQVSQVWEELARRFLAPPIAQQTLGGEHVAFMAVEAQGSTKGQDEGVAEKVREDQFVGIPIVPRKIAQAVELDGTMQLARAAETLGAFTIISVDSVAETDPRSKAPDYPKDLLAKGVEGKAVFQFVIDSTGLVDMSTVREVSATHKQFAQAVRAAMPAMRFRPAMRNLIFVRQLVEQPFAFKIDEVAPVAPAPRKP